MSMLKLQARKQRQASSPIAASGTASAGVGSSSGITRNDGHNALSFIDRLEHAAAPSSPIEEVRARPSGLDPVERAAMIDRIHTENKHLLALLLDLREAKATILRKAAEADRAQEILSSLQPCAVSDLDAFIARANLSLTTNAHLTEEDKDKIREQIVALVSRFQSSQKEVMQQVVDQLQTLYNLIQQPNSLPAAFEELKKLENVIDGRPINVQGMTALAANASKALLATLSDQVNRDLRFVANASTATITSNSNTNLGNSVSSQNSWNEANGEGNRKNEVKSTTSSEKLIFSAEEVQHLLSQNETMRNTITQLRQRLAQSKTVSESSTASTGRRSSIYGRRAAAQAKPVTATITSSSALHESETTTSQLISSSSIDPVTTQQSVLLENKVSSEVVYMPVLRSFVLSYLSSDQQSYLWQTLQYHPLFPSIQGTAVPPLSQILDVMLHEIAGGLAEPVTELFSDLLRSNADFQSEVRNNYGGEEDAEFWRKAAVVDCMHNSIMSILNLSVVFEEVMNLGTLYLSYLHSLFELQVDLTDYLPPQSSADSVELPVASEAAELPPDNKNNRELIAPEDVLDLADSQSRDLFSSRSQSTYSVLSSPANRASLFRTRSSAPSIASSGPRTSTQHHSEVSLHQADSNPSMTSTLFKQNSNQKLPRYMMHSKSFSNKVKTKHSSKNSSE